MQQNRWFLLASLGLITTILFALAALTQWDAQAAPAQYETSLSNLALQADPTSTPLISPFPSPTLTVTIEAEPVAITFTNTSQPPQPTLFNTPGITLAINLTTTNDITAALTHGPLSGEVTDTSAVLWARGNQNGQILFTVWPVEPIDMGDDMDGMDDTTDDTSTDDTDT
ncbi:MAG TPA: hypothetical protein VLL52_24825, partial [Anaerolineae bacterium]|nr:hypothetical protein [Anaerolineae bacterium]